MKIIKIAMIVMCMDQTLQAISNKDMEAAEKYLRKALEVVSEEILKKQVEERLNGTDIY